MCVFPASPLDAILGRASWSIWMQGLNRDLQFFATREAELSSCSHRQLEFQALRIPSFVDRVRQIIFQTHENLGVSSIDEATHRSLSKAGRSEVR